MRGCRNGRLAGVRTGPVSRTATRGESAAGRVAAAAAFSMRSNWGRQIWRHVVPATAAALVVLLALAALTPAGGRTDPAVDTAVAVLRLEGRKAVKTGDRTAFVRQARNLLAVPGTRIAGVRLLAGRGLVVEQVPPEMDFHGHELRREPLGPDMRFEVALAPPQGTFGRRIVPALVGFAVAAAAAFLWFVSKVERPLAALGEALPAVSETGEPILLPARPWPRIEEIGRRITEVALSFHEQSRTSQANLLALEEAFEKIRSVLHSLGEGVLVTDHRGDVVLSNPAAARILGSAREGIRGRDVLSLFPETDALRLKSAMADVRRDRRLRFLDGVEIGGRVFHLSIAPILDGKDSVRDEERYGVSIVMLDMTAAVEIARMKDEFLSSVSHELRTPLTSIRSYTEILLHMTPEDEETWKEFLGIVSTEAERLTRLVNEILDLARMEAGEMDFRIEPVDVGHLLRTVAAVFDPLLREKECSLVLDLPESLPPAHADRDRLHQVLTNLMGNACKFLPNGGVVRLGTRPKGDELEFWVEDSGPGIPDEERERVFEKFKQVGDSLTDKPKGTGLGLPICREILQRMGGRIWCDRSPELGGARFRFTLPVSREARPTW